MDIIFLCSHFNNCSSKRLVKIIYQVKKKFHMNLMYLNRLDVFKVILAFSLKFILKTCNLFRQ